MTVSSEFSNRTAPTGDALPAEFSDAIHVNKSRVQDANGRPGPAAENTGPDEPSFALEPDLPSDGRDEIGEAMIRELPQRPELSEPPSQPSQTP